MLSVFRQVAGGHPQKAAGAGLDPLRARGNTHLRHEIVWPSILGTEIQY